MKFLILFAVGVLFGSVQCDDECFRAIFKECAREPVPMDRMTLCDEVKYQINCVEGYAKKCNMEFSAQAYELKKTVNIVCATKSLMTWYNKDRACYVKNMNATECIGPIRDAMKDSKTPEDMIRANKKICGLFNTYSTCVDKDVRSDCGPIPWALFRWMYEPLQHFSNSLCEQLIVPSDEKDSRPDNFGNINVVAGAVGLFYSE